MKGRGAANRSLATYFCRSSVVLDAIDVRLVATMSTEDLGFHRNASVLKYLLSRATLESALSRLVATHDSVLRRPRSRWSPKEDIDQESDIFDDVRYFCNRTYAWTPPKNDSSGTLIVELVNAMIINLQRNLEKRLRLEKDRLTLNEARVDFKRGQREKEMQSAFRSRPKQFHDSWMRETFIFVSPFLTRRLGT